MIFYKPRFSILFVFANSWWLGSHPRKHRHSYKWTISKKHLKGFSAWATFFATADTQADCRPTSLLTCCSCCPSQRVLHNYSAELTVYAVMVHLAGSPVAWQKRTIWALSSKQSTFFLTHKPFFHTRNLFSLIYMSFLRKICCTLKEFKNTFLKSNLKP